MIILLFYTVLGSASLALACAHRAAAKPNWIAIVQSMPGQICFAALALLALSTLRLIRSYRLTAASDRQKVCVGLLINFVTFVLTLGSAEFLVRNQVSDSPQGRTFRSHLLYPLEWAEVVARHQPVLDRMSKETPFFVHDPNLGWVTGSNRTSANGLYASSVEGLRSPRVGLSFTDGRTGLSRHHEHPAAVRIALIGDSMTFGHEVRCEKSWAHMLEQNLGSEVQILNFAVSGYSVSQAFLQYRQAVHAWHPDIVVLSVTSSMILRMMNVYNFLISPTGIEFPFARPRLVLESHDWRPINLPVPTPKEIFSSPSLEHLPYLDQDRYYQPVQWAQGHALGALQRSYLFRVLNSIQPPTGLLAERFSDDALVALTGRVLQAFLTDVREDGAVPLIVHLPYQYELRWAAAGMDDVSPRGASLLRRTDFRYVAATPCLLEANQVDNYAPGGHYAPPANEALARCLADVLRPDVERALSLRERRAKSEASAGKEPRRSREDRTD